MDDNGSLRILLVDDDEDLLELLAYNFIQDGFDVRTVRDSKKAVATAMDFKPHLIVLDISMPDEDGFNVCKSLRNEISLRNIYIFFLTAHSANRFLEAALDNGADDYIEKLSGIRALTNKVSAVLKNNFIIQKRVTALRLGDVRVDNRSETVFLRNRRIPLARPELDILFFFMQNPNKVISLDHLIRIMWGSRAYIRDSSVRVYVDNLQRKFGRKRIEMVKRGQYRYNPAIR